LATGNVFNPQSANFIFTDPDLIDEYRLMSPMSLLRNSRLALFARIAVKQPSAVVSILNIMWDIPRGWVAAVKSDLQWFSYAGHLLFPPAQVSNIFASLSGAAGGVFIKKVRAYAATRFANFDVPFVVRSLAPPMFLPSTCPHCSKVFAGYQRMALHMKVVHDILDPVHMLVDDVFCPVCLLYFHNRVRLLNHLKYRSSVCRLNLVLQGPLLSSERARELDIACRAHRRELYAKGLRAHAALFPVVRLHGPLPPAVVLDHLASHHHLLGIGRRYYS
jgi:hypothetical protein